MYFVLLKTVRKFRHKIQLKVLDFRRLIPTETISSKMEFGTEGIQVRMFQIWRDSNQKGFKPEGIQTWGDSNLKGFKPERIQTWRDSNLKGFNIEGIQTWRNSSLKGFKSEGIQTWRDFSSIYLTFLEPKEFGSQGITGSKVHVFGL